MGGSSSKPKINQTFLFYYSLFLVALLLATVNIDNQYILYGLIVGCVVLIFNPIYLIPVYFISSLASTYFIAGAGLGISRIIGSILIISGIMYIFRNKKNIANKKNLAFILVILVFSFISAAFSLTMSFQYFFMLIQYFLVVFIFGQFRNVNLSSLTILILISSIITILVLALTLKQDLILIKAQRLSTSDEVNENRFAMMLAQLCAVIFAGILIFKQYKIIQFFFVLVLFLGYFMLILSGSRSATFGLTLAIVVCILFLNWKQIKRFIFPFLLIVITGYFLFDFLIKFDIPLINRFSLEGLESAGGSQVRFTNWKTLIPVAIENKLFFGYGFGPENVIDLAKQKGLSKPAHNFLIDLFLQTGVIGVLLFFSYFIYVGKKLISKLKEPLIYFPIIIILTALFNGVGETIFLEKLFWNGIALAWLYVNNSNSKLVFLKPVMSK